MRRRACLISTSQPSANPRLVKEADALNDAGFEVTVIGAHLQEWATAGDAALLANRTWTFEFLDWRRETAPWLFWKSRVRHKAARLLIGLPGLGTRTMAPAAGRLTPELTASALRTPADLYVAHNAGALPAAAAAARARGAYLGFDAEDFHSGQFRPGDDSGEQRATVLVERRFVPACDYVTAASPAIAQAYAPLCRGGTPTTVLNVFPSSERPAARRPASLQGPLRAYWFSQTIGPHRGLEAAVRAMSLLPDGAVELHLQGRWQGGYEQALRGVAAGAGVVQSRIVAHDPAPADALVRTASAFDVGLALEPGSTPNSDMALSNKLFAYLLAGTAVLATGTSAQRALCDQIPGACTLVDPDDAEGVARALSAWGNHREVLERAREQAWTAGAARFNWDVEKQTFLGVIEALFDPAARAVHSTASRLSVRAS